MQFLLQKSAEQLNAGKAAQEKKQWEIARRCFLGSADYLYQAAAQSTGQFRQQRVANAEALVAHANGLPQKQAAPVAVAPETGSAWLVHERPDVRFADVAGLEDVKEQIRLKLIYPFSHPDLAAQYGVRRGGGILLYGPPGTGKTLIARAVAGEVDAAFFSVKPSEIMSKWVGAAEQNIAKLFAAAREHPRAVLFIDEVESLVPKRRSNGSTIMKRVVPQILAELEGFDTHVNTLLFIGATNEPWSLDPAVLRPGRFDEKIYVGLPDEIARERIVALALADRPLDPAVTFAWLVDCLSGYSGADIVNVCRKACSIPFIESVQTGIARPILQQDFETVLATVTPSVTQKDVVRFSDYTSAK